MKKDEYIINAREMTLIAQGQSIAGKLLQIGGGMVSTKSETTPYRILDGSAVYYSGYNIFDLQEPEFKPGKIKKWGEFYHPYLMFGMPDRGGWNKIYIDTRIDGYYLLWVASKLDDWASGPDAWVASVIAWTPKAKNDSVNKAGTRMFWAIGLAMDDVAPGEYNSDFYGEAGEWVNEWLCSIKCKQVFAAIRKTNYKDEHEYLNIIGSAPDVLKPHIALRKNPI